MVRQEKSLVPVLTLQVPQEGRTDRERKGAVKEPLYVNGITGGGEDGKDVVCGTTRRNDTAGDFRSLREWG